MHNTGLTLAKLWVTLSVLICTTVFVFVFYMGNILSELTFYLPGLWYIDLPAHFTVNYFYVCYFDILFYYNTIFVVVVNIIM